MDLEILRGFEYVLLYGSPASRHELANKLIEQDNPDIWSILASTVRNSEDWVMRRRCLELLGIVAGSSDEEAARHVFAALEV